MELGARKFDGVPKNYLLKHLQSSGFNIWPRILRDKQEFITLSFRIIFSTQSSLLQYCMQHGKIHDPSTTVDKL